MVPDIENQTTDLTSIRSNFPPMLSIGKEKHYTLTQSKFRGKGYDTNINVSINLISYWVLKFK